MAEHKRSVEQEVESLYRSHYRLACSGWVGGENRITVEVGEEPKATATTRKVWHRKHAWSGTNLEVHLTISRTWRRSVRERGLAVLDGLLTTHAGPVTRDADAEACPATWVRQGRGLSIRVESGWIAYHRLSGTAFHLPGGDATKAIAALRRKMRNQAIPQEERDELRRRRYEARQARLERMVGRMTRFDLGEVGGVVVIRQDSLRAGNCEPGTDEFIARYFPDRSMATIAEIAAAVGEIDLEHLDEQRLTLARQIGAACLVAIRRNRRERRRNARWDSMLPPDPHSAHHPHSLVCHSRSEVSP